MLSLLGFVFIFFVAVDTVSSVTGDCESARDNAYAAIRDCVSDNNKVVRNKCDFCRNLLEFSRTYTGIACNAYAGAGRVVYTIERAIERLDQACKTTESVPVGCDIVIDTYTTVIEKCVGKNATRDGCFCDRVMQSYGRSVVAACKGVTEKETVLKNIAQNMHRFEEGCAVETLYSVYKGASIFAAVLIGVFINTIVIDAGMLKVIK